MSNTASLSELLQDVNLMDEKALEYYHKVIVRLINANNNTIKQEVIDQVNTEIGSTVNSDVTAKIDKLREELTKASEKDLAELENALTTEINKIKDSKQDKITGSEGQSITFDKDGNLIVVDKTSGGGGAVNAYNRHFQESEWAGTSKNEIRIPFSEHGLAPTTSETVFSVYGVTGHNITDYDDSTTQLDEFKADILAMYKAAIEANNATAGTYPTDANGYIVFTWEQIQYYLLEDVLATAEVAAAKAVELNFNWKDIKTLNVEPTCTLQDYMNAAYMPALNGPAVQFNNLSTNQNIQGWRFRRTILKNGELEPGYAGKYDMNGFFDYTWGAACTVVHYDKNTKDIVIHNNISNAPYEGFILAVSDTE